MKYCDNFDCIIKNSLTGDTYCTVCGQKTKECKLCTCGKMLSPLGQYCGSCGLHKEQIDEEQAERDHLDREENLKHKEN